MTKLETEEIMRGNCKYYNPDELTPYDGMIDNVRGKLHVCKNSTAKDGNCNHCIAYRKSPRKRYDVPLSVHKNNYHDYSKCGLKLLQPPRFKRLKLNPETPTINKELERVHRRNFDRNYKLCMKHNEMVRIEKLPRFFDPTRNSRMEFSRFNAEYVLFYDGGPEGRGFGLSRHDKNFKLMGLDCNDKGCGYDARLLEGHVRGYNRGDIKLSNVQLNNVVFEDCEFKFGLFDNVILKNCKFDHCEFDVDPRWSKIGTTTFDHSKVFSYNYAGLTIHRNNHFVKSYLKGEVFEDKNFKCRIFGIPGDGGIRFLDNNGGNHNV